MSVLLVGATTCYSYFILISYLQHEDEDFLSSRLNDVETRLAKNPDGLNELASAWRDDSSTDFSSLTIVIRVLGSDGVGMALMQGSDRVPWPSNSAKQNTPEMKKETGG